MFDVGREEARAAERQMQSQRKAALNQPTRASNVISHSAGIALVGRK